MVMRKEVKKYTIRESELKEIIQEMLLIEIYDASAYKGMHTPNYQGDSFRLGDYLKTGWNTIKGIPGALASDEYKEKVAAGDNKFLQGLLGVQAANPGVSVKPDRPPIIGQRNGTNTDAHEPFNVAAAVNWLRTHANKTFTKKCALYVRKALNQGGLSAPFNMDGSAAKNYYQILPANGWDEIPTRQAGQPGDVLVITPCKDSKGFNHPYGHIAMCLGNGVWASDFIQSSMYGLKGEPPVSAVHVFRYRNRV